MADQKNDALNDAEKQKVLQELKKQALDKLKEAIELNRINNRTKRAREAKAEACALMLVAIRAGVQFDPKDPIFQIFVQRQSWRDAMGRACKEVCDPTTALARGVMNVLNLIPGEVGRLVRNFVNLFEKHGVKPMEQAEVYNRDLWNDFYDEIPKDGGNSQFAQRSSGRLELGSRLSNINVQKFLSRGVATNQTTNRGPRRIGTQRLMPYNKQKTNAA